MPTLLRNETMIAKPWKNGGGITTEIAVFPEGAGFDEFEWRVSLATIAASGPFSSFPGIDRSLTLVDGGGVELLVDGGRRVELSRQSPTFNFPGESVVHAKPMEGETNDFNVMSRRGVCKHSLHRRRFSGVDLFLRRCEVTLLFVAEGQNLLCTCQDHALRLNRFDALLLHPGDPIKWTLEAEDHILFFLVEIEHQKGGHSA